MADILDMDWAAYREFLRKEARKTGTPAFGTFELTPLCNFNCKMCYVHLSPERMHELGRLRTADEWVDMARQAQELGTVWITLTGGEVLTRPDFAEIYSRISDLGMMVSILSNGSLITDEIVELFSERRPTYMRFTLYGASNETYERLCGVPDGFDNVMRALQRLSAAKIPFSLAFTETVENSADRDAAVAIADELGTNILTAGRLVPAVRGANSDAERLRVSRSGEKTPAIECPKDEGISASIDDAFDPFSKCRSYRNSFWIDWDGNMEGCAFMSSCGTKPFEIGLKDAWRDLLDLLAKIKTPEACRSCRYRYLCSACPGVLEAETGSAERVCTRICSEVYELARKLEQ